MTEIQFGKITNLDISGITGSAVVTTVVNVCEPTLLQPMRYDFTSTSGVGEIRIGVTPSGPMPQALYPPAWVNGDIWLPHAGDWDITVASKAEDRTSNITFALPYISLPNPDAHTLAAVRNGQTAGRAAYHAEVVTTEWNQVMKLEQRLIVRQKVTLSALDGDIRYRWNGPPGTPDGISYDFLAVGSKVVIDPAPLASLWVRSDEEGLDVDINFLSQRLR